MKKLDSFILKSFFGPFIMTFCITVFILVMQFLWLYIDELVGKGLSFWVIMEFLGWGSATILPLSMPLATLLASIMTFGNLGENNELLAMKAAGISLQRIFYPLIFVAFFISVAAFFVSNNLIPIAYNKIYTLQYDIAKTKEEIKIPTGSFYNGIDGYSLRINSRNKKTDMMYDVILYNHTKNNGNVSMVVADSGMIKSTVAKDALVFTLYDGVSYEENNKYSYKDTTLELQQIKFDMQEVIIPLENYAFQKSEDDRYGNDIMARNLKQLKHDRDSIGALYDEEAIHQREDVVYNISMNKPENLDTAKNKGYVNDYPLDSLMNSCSTADKLMAVREAIPMVQNSIFAMKSYHRDVYRYTFYLRRIDLESLRKFALSIACFIFFFIGAPLGAIIRKGGLGTPVIISAILFVLYWVVDITGKKLARDGVISPTVGAFISTWVFLPVGVFLTWKSTKDSSIFNIDTYLQPVKNFFKSKLVKKRKIMSTDGALSKGRKIRIVFMGTSGFAVTSLKALLDEDYNVVGVVTVPDRKSGRGQKISCSPVKEYLLSMDIDIPLLQPESLKDEEFINSLKELNADLFIVTAFRMLPEAVWMMPPMGTFNLHASLLPRYRGAAPINWAIINGETKTGVTTFMLDKHIDTGAVLFQKEVPILPEDNVQTLHDKLAVVGAGLTLKTVNAIASEDVSYRPQDQIKVDIEEYQRYAPKLNRDTGRIDWNRDAESIRNLIRGLSPRPGAHAVLAEGDKETDIKIFSSEIVHDEEVLKSLADSVPGTLYTDYKTMLCVKCGKDVISLTEIQCPGKKRLPVSSFLAGWRCEDGFFR